MTSIFETLRQTHPYRLLLIATLALVVLAQGVAMVMLTRSQVQKAQARDAQERSLRTAAIAAEGTAVKPQAPAKQGVMKVGYVASR